MVTELRAHPLIGYEETLRKHPPMPDVELTRDTAALACISVLMATAERYAKRIREGSQQPEEDRQCVDWATKTVHWISGRLQVLSGHYRRDDVAARLQQFLFRGRPLFDYKHPQGDAVSPSDLGAIAMSRKVADGDPQKTQDVFTGFLRITLDLLTARSDEPKPDRWSEVAPWIDPAEYTVATWDEGVPNTFRALKEKEWVN